VPAPAGARSVGPSTGFIPRKPVTVAGEWLAAREQKILEVVTKAE
jgi:hypothetical protein